MCAPPAQRPEADVFDDQPHHGASCYTEQARDPERLAVVDHQRVGDRGAEHEDGAVRQVEDVENAEDQRVADGEKSVDGPEEDRV
jgi:hypothetical protein